MQPQVPATYPRSSCHASSLMLETMLTKVCVGQAGCERATILAYEQHHIPRTGFRCEMLTRAMRWVKAGAGSELEMNHVLTTGSLCMQGTG